MSSDFLSYEVDNWEPDSLVLPLSLNPNGPFHPFDVKKWFIQTANCKISIAQVCLLGAVVSVCVYIRIYVYAQMRICISDICVTRSLCFLYVCLGTHIRIHSYY